MDCFVQFNIGRTPGDSSVGVIDLSSSEVARRRACASVMRLNHNTTYYSTLTVFNRAMNSQSISASSNGGK